MDFDFGDGSKYEGIVVARRNPATRGLEFLVLDYEPLISPGEYGPVQVKYPGGRVDPCDKKYGDTAIRELHAETGLRVRPDARQHLAFYFRVDRWGHSKSFFWINEEYVEGKLRDYPLYETHSRLSNFRWEPASKLMKLRDDLRPIMYGYHHEAMKMAIAKIGPPDMAGPAKIA